MQSQLFDIGADLLQNPILKKMKIDLRSNKILETELDNLNKDLNSLTSFILPGGTVASAFLHLSRTTIRRAERTIVDLLEFEEVNPTLLQYINRLSDFLFVAARFENKKEGDIL